MKLTMSAIIAVALCISCKNPSIDSEQKFIFGGSDSDHPTKFSDWLSYTEITEEQQKTVDAIFENSAHLGVTKKNKSGAQKIANSMTLDLGSTGITNLDPVLSLGKISVLYLMPNPDLSQKEVDKVGSMINIKQLIVPKHLKCPKQFPNNYGEICIKSSMPN